MQGNESNTLVFQRMTATEDHKQMRKASRNGLRHAISSPMKEREILESVLVGTARKLGDIDA
jgi:hypothetical protein